MTSGRKPESESLSRSLSVALSLCLSLSLSLPFALSGSLLLRLLSPMLSLALRVSPSRSLQAGSHLRLQLDSEICKPRDLVIWRRKAPYIIRHGPGRNAGPTRKVRRPRRGVKCWAAGIFVHSTSSPSKWRRATLYRRVVNHPFDTASCLVPYIASKN